MQISGRNLTIIVSMSKEKREYVLPDERHW